MANYKRIRLQQTIRQAEGYLDLVTVFDDRWSLAADIRDRVAARVIDLLQGVDCSGQKQSHVLYLMGRAQQASQQYEAAIETLSHAADIDPDNIHIWLSLGWCYKRTNRLDLAIEALEEALAVDSSEAIIHYNLACYWALAENVRLAVDYLAQSFDLDPDYRDMVADEADFDAIRNHPEFLTITSVIV